MNQIVLPEHYNYIAVFLTLTCNMYCSYCITRHGELCGESGRLSGREWVVGLNRITLQGGLPATLQGGEPSLHPDFRYIINNLRNDLPIDILTNLTFDITEFIRTVRPERIRRDAPYASIRVSYHPEQMDLESLLQKVLTLQEAGYSVGVWGVLHPAYVEDVLAAKDYCESHGVDFRTKEFLGVYEGRLYGTYSYGDSCHGNVSLSVDCRTSELIIGPAGGIYRCHADLYEGRKPVGHILDPDFTISSGFRHCRHYGRCNPCDVKLKTDRFQQFGHTSVDIRAEFLEDRPVVDHVSGRASEAE